MTSRKFTFELPSSPEYCDIARLATASVAREAGFSEGKIDDIRAAVSEACINVIQHAYEDQNNPIHLTFFIHSKELEILVQDQGKGFDIQKVKKNAVPLDPKNPKTSGYGLLIIQNIMDEVHISSDDKSGSCVRMTLKLS